MTDAVDGSGVQEPFLYAVILPSGEVFATHRNKLVAEGIATLEREYCAECKIIPLYAHPQSIPDSEHKPEGA